MNGLLEQFAADPWGRLVLQYLESGGLRSGFLLLLVVARLAGMFVIACCGFAFHRLSCSAKLQTINLQPAWALP